MPGPRYLAAAAAVTIAVGGAGFAVAESSGAPTADTPLCGASFLVEAEFGDENYQDAFDRLNADYGLESVRVFYGGLPKPWPGKLDAGGLPMTISFKADPAAITAGDHDTELSEWFANAPTDRDLYWSYYHEPEDNIEAGQFTAAEYVRAWEHLIRLAAEADNDSLYATEILMGWTADPNSGRDWRDYLPSDGIEVLAWDAYNQVKPDPSEYRGPEEIFGATVEVNRELGLPYAVAETGSGLVPGDDGSERAAWLSEVVAYLTEADARFVQYFDIDFTAHGHSDYRLRDEAGRNAWRDFCAA